MSAKVCLPAWNGGPHKTEDAVTIGQLELMIDALNAIGYDVDTPVTFLFDDDHVWLETVEFDMGEVYSGVKVPRIVQSLGADERGAEWVDRDGDHHRYSRCWEHKYENMWIETCDAALTGFGPYTEVV